MGVPEQKYSLDYHLNVSALIFPWDQLKDTTFLSYCFYIYPTLPQNIAFYLVEIWPSAYYKLFDILAAGV